MLPLSLSLGLAWLASVSTLARAGSVTEGGTCDIAHNRLSPDTKQFSSDCTATTYCASDNTCHRKGCRTAEYPFGYRQWSHIIPDRCPKGQFCPDEEDACQALLPVGSACQLNRDDECEAPPNYNELAGPNNHNGSVCLNYTCMWANATLGNACVVENTAYIGYEAGSGTQYINVVSRGNCVTGLYCDSQTLQCLKTLDIGASCTADKECASDNCTPQGVCGAEPNTSKHLPVAIYVVVAICILGLMLGVIGGLYFVHRRNRTEEREKRAQYWREQEQFRQNIMQMREQARTSLLSLPWQSQPASPRNYSGANLEEYNNNKDFNSITPMLHAAAQPSGLRNEFSDNGSEDNGGTEETLVMRPGPRGAAAAANGSSTSTGRRAGAPTKRI